MQINTASQLLAVLPLCCARVWICGGLSQAIYNPSMYFPAALAARTCIEGSIQHTHTFPFHNLHACRVIVLSRVILF